MFSYVVLFVVIAFFCTHDLILPTRVAKSALRASSFSPFLLFHQAAAAAAAAGAEAILRLYERFLSLSSSTSTGKYIQDLNVLPLRTRKRVR